MCYSKLFDCYTYVSTLEEIVPSLVVKLKNVLGVLWLHRVQVNTCTPHLIT